MLRTTDGLAWLDTTNEQMVTRMFKVKYVEIEALRGVRLDSGDLAEHARKALQQLEAAGYIAKVQGKGRLISSEGMKKIDRLATEIHKELVKAAPQLQRYA